MAAPSYVSTLAWRPDPTRASAVALLALGPAAALPTYVDGAAGFLAFLALLAVSGSAWARPVAALAWLAARVWPCLTTAPSPIYDALVAIAGLAFHTRVIDDARVPEPAQHLIAAAYAVLALAPFHGAPGALASCAFALSAAAEFVVDPSTADPLAIARPCVWVLCVRDPRLSPAAAALAIVAAAWRARSAIAAPPKPKEKPTPTHKPRAPRRDIPSIAAARPNTPAPPSAHRLARPPPSAEPPEDFGAAEPLTSDEP